MSDEELNTISPEPTSAPWINPNIIPDTHFIPLDNIAEQAIVSRIGERIRLRCPKHNRGELNVFQAIEVGDRLHEVAGKILGEEIRKVDPEKLVKKLIEKSKIQDQKLAHADFFAKSQSHMIEALMDEIASYRDLLAAFGVGDLPTRLVINGGFVDLPSLSYYRERLAKQAENMNGRDKIIQSLNSKLADQNKKLKELEELVSSLVQYTNPQEPGVFSA